MTVAGHPVLDQAVEAQFSDPIGPDVYTMFPTWMVDHAAAEQDAKPLQARQAAVTK